MRIALIVAAAANNVIGLNNQLPWHLPQDLKHFRSVTWGKPIIMGRKTYESIGKPLPGRTNIVISRQPHWTAEGALAAESLPAALALGEAVAREKDSLAEELMIIGGAQVYREALPLAQRIYMTRVNVAVEGDAFFPALLPSDWEQAGATPGDEGASLPHEFQIWERTTR